jgi:hypothetical protein
MLRKIRWARYVALKIAKNMQNVLSRDHWSTGHLILDIIKICTNRPSYYASDSGG